MRTNLAGIDQRKPRPGDFTDPGFWTRRNRAKVKKPVRTLTTEPLADIFNVDRTGYFIYRSSAGKVFLRCRKMDVSKTSPPIEFVGKSTVGSSKEVLREAKARFT